MLDARLLAQHALDGCRHRLLTHGDEPAPPTRSARNSDAALFAGARRANHFAYITGVRRFWNIDIEVTWRCSFRAPKPNCVGVLRSALRTRPAAAHRRCLHGQRLASSGSAFSSC